MNELLEILGEYKFERLGHKLSEPIVINCVPGAGKTHLIRTLLDRCDNFEAFTTGVPDAPNLTGKRIAHISKFKNSGKLVLLDEYQNLPTLPEGLFAVFGDPLQSKSPILLPANFISYKSRRFGKNTAKLLQALDFKVHSDLEDEVIIKDIFIGEPEGQIICFEQEVIDLLRAHNLDFLTPCSCQGESFEVVTFVTTGSVSSDNKHEHLICLSRHKAKLIILCPQSKYPNVE